MISSLRARQFSVAFEKSRGGYAPISLADKSTDYSCRHTISSESPSMFVLVAAAATTSSARGDYILSYDWKFASESSPKPQNCSASKFPDNLTDKQCFGLFNQAQVADEETCRETCCGSDECTVWQWCRPGHACSPANSCWTGDNVDVSSCTSTQSGWASPGRSRPGPP